MEEVFIFDMGKPVKIIDLARNIDQVGGFIPVSEIQVVEPNERRTKNLH
jgi:FlaA1/EpsC-like NDP-sugar epimerase